MRRVLEILGWGCALLLAIRLPGEIVNSIIRLYFGGSAPERVSLVVSMVATALILRRITRSTWHIGFRPIGALAVAFALTATLAQVASVVTENRAYVEVSDVGILVPTPRQRWEDCRGLPRRCHEHVLNELGFRGSLAHRATPDAKLIAFIGDSSIFGAGVAEEDTVPAAVARALSDLQPPVAVVNAGIEGANGISFAGIISYVRKRLSPEVIVVLLKDDDVDDTDKLTRWNDFRRSFWSRVSYVINFEPISTYVREVWRGLSAQRDRAELLARHLNSIATAASGAKLLVVTFLTDDLHLAFSKWMAAHPDVVHVSSWDDSRLWQAETIPHDGHWSEAGCQEIAGIVVPRLRAQLSGVPTM